MKRLIIREKDNISNICEKRGEFSQNRLAGMMGIYHSSFHKMLNSGRQVYMVPVDGGYDFYELKKLSEYREDE